MAASMLATSLPLLAVRGSVRCFQPGPDGATALGALNNCCRSRTRRWGIRAPPWRCSRRGGESSPCRLAGTAFPSGRHGCLKGPLCGCGVCTASGAIDAWLTGPVPPCHSHRNQ